MEETYLEWKERLHQRLSGLDEYDAYHIDEIERIQEALLNITEEDFNDSFKY